MLLELLLAFLILSISTCISLLITVPLFGALIRFRANFSPKSLALQDGEGGLQPHTGPVVTGYWAMLARVKRIEGWKGLYKGLMPTLIATVVVTSFAAIYVGASLANPRGRYSMPQAGILETLVYTTFFALLTIPMNVIVNRAITTPHRLPSFAPVYGLRLLLTPYERSRPWVIFLTPGLVASQLLHIAYVVLVLHSFRRLLLPSSFLKDDWINPESGEPQWPKDFTALRFSLYFLITALSTVVLCPLEVIATRLSLQRNHAPGGGFSAVPQDEQTALGVEQEPEFAGAEEDVIGLRSEEDPYTGLADCARRILAEEGKQTLFRGWWITLLAGSLSALG